MPDAESAFCARGIGHAARKGDRHEQENHRRHPEAP